MAKKICESIESLNEWVGRNFSWLIIPLMFFVVFDVILRYIFNRPTIWAWDINIQLLGVLVVLGGGYAYRHDAHIGVDIIPLRLSPQKRAIIDIITSGFFFFGFGVLFWKAAGDAIFSAKIREVYSSVFAPPIYPFKFIIVVGILLLLLQGIAKFIKNLNKVIIPEEREKK